MAPFVITVFSEIGKSKASGFFFVISPDETFSVAVVTAKAVPRRWIRASSRLHTAPCLESRDHVSRGSIVSASASNEFATVRITAGKVQEVDSSKGYQKTAEQRQGVDRIGGVESAKQDK